MKKYYKKVNVDAIQYLGNFNEIKDFTDGQAVKEVSNSRIKIGTLTLDYSDYIVREFEKGTTVYKTYRQNIFEKEFIII